MQLFSTFWKERRKLHLEIVRRHCCCRSEKKKGFTLFIKIFVCLLVYSLFIDCIVCPKKKPAQARAGLHQYSDY